MSNFWSECLSLLMPVNDFSLGQWSEDFKTSILFLGLASVELHSNIFSFKKAGPLCQKQTKVFDTDSL